MRPNKPTREEVTKMAKLSKEQVAQIGELLRQVNTTGKAVKALARVDVEYAVRANNELRTLVDRIEQVLTSNSNG